MPFDPRSAEGLAARWLQWVASCGIDDPIADKTGEFAGRNQPEDVFFLAGSYGKDVTRRTSVPEGRELFIPLFNVWQRARHGQLLVEGAYGSLAVDGYAIEPVVVSTPVPFPVVGKGLNPVTGRSKPVEMTIWGLWGRVPALPLGEHELRAVGGVGDGFAVDVTYRLSVAAPFVAPVAYPTW